MRKVYIVLVSLLFVAGAAFAQKVNVDVDKATTVPVIDGIEEETWDAVTPVDIVRPFMLETPTVTAYWKALWNDTAIYVLVNVEDDSYWPGWDNDPAGAGWMFDKPEIYFDVNDVLVDALGLGPVNDNTGHYQWSPDPTDGGDDTPTFEAVSNRKPAGWYAYVITGESWVYEYCAEITSMHQDAVNGDGAPLTCEKILALPEKVGFDATVIDQDKDITTTRERMVWQSKDAEAWNDMAASGTITLLGACGGGSGINPVQTVNVAVHPNPVTDFVTIDASFDKVVINNILGQEVSTMTQIKTNRLDVSNLSQGVYIIKVYKGEKYIGAAKINKN